MPELLDATGKPVNPESSESNTTADAVKFAPAEEVAELKTTVTSLNDTIAQLRGALDMVARNTSSPQVTQPAEPELTDEEINAALQNAEEGNPAAKVRRMMQSAVRASETRLKTEVEQLKATGMSSLAEVAAQQAASTLPRFKEFEKDIRATVAQLPPESQASAISWKLAHDAIVGGNYDKLVERERETWARQNREEAAQPSTPGTGERVREDGTPLPSPESLGGNLAREALMNKGVSEDDFAKKLGYENWADYMTKTAEIVGA
jgi:hypothetical protein